MLLVEQNARVALAFAEYGYILESGRIVFEGTSASLQDNPVIRESYLGTRKDTTGPAFGQQKRYRRRRRWLA